MMLISDTNTNIDYLEYPISEEEKARSWELAYSLFPGLREAHLAAGIDYSAPPAEEKTDDDRER